MMRMSLDRWSSLMGLGMVSSAQTPWNQRTHEQNESVGVENVIDALIAKVLCSSCYDRPRSSKKHVQRKGDDDVNESVCQEKRGCCVIGELPSEQFPFDDDKTQDELNEKEGDNHR